MAEPRDSAIKNASFAKRPLLGFLAPTAYVIIRLLLPPETFHDYWINFALIAETKTSISHEWFHPLYPFLLSLIASLRHAAGSAGSSLFAVQLLSLFGAAAYLWLIYQISYDFLQDELWAFLSSLLATASINLWICSMQPVADTLSIAMMLICLRRLFRTEAYTLKNVAVLGCMTGLAAGLNVACIVLAPVITVDILWREKSQRHQMKSTVAYLSIFVAAWGASYLPLLWKLWVVNRVGPLAIAHLLGVSTANIVTLTISGSLLDQWTQFKTTDAPQDMPYLFLLFFHAALLFLTYNSRSSLKRVVRVGIVYFVCAFIFFILCEPVNWFAHIMGLLIPVLAALLLVERRWSAVLMVALWASLVTQEGFEEGRFLPQQNPGFNEGRYIASRMTKRDLIVAVSEPDWEFSYFMMDKVPVAQALWPEDSHVSFGLIAAVPGEDLNDRIRKTLHAKGRVLLASDSLFRSSAIPRDRMDIHISELLHSFDHQFVIGEDIISPQRFHYYQLSLSARRLAASLARQNKGPRRFR
jgi:hypothetical protein